ncbi:MAG: TIGR03986 family CRISPR-associated RAMP protein, partial [bacterium]|nr:TIGR03986 family CRISPR-associated RAMP protein [bacterium]
GEGRRLIVRDGKQKYFNDTMKPFPIDTLIGKTATMVKIHNSLIIEIKLENGGVFPAATPKSEDRTTHYSEPSNRMTIDTSRTPARAPYNFIPLNNQVVKGQGAVDFSKFHNGKLNGYIDLEIAAQSDIFTRGKLEKFFMINNQYAIPGSSLRGLIRSLVEIAGYGKVEHVDKMRKLFFRNISDKHYKKVFLNSTKNNGQEIVSQKSKAGWLSVEGNKYFITEAPSFYKVNRSRLKELHMDKSDSVYHIEDIWFNPAAIKPFHVKKINSDKSINLEYNIATSISLLQRDGFIKGTLLITGTFANTKHFQWIIPPPLQDVKYDITSLVQEYVMDKNRDEGADLLKALKKRSNGNAVPCFYITDSNGKPLAIGHTGIFRYPYKYNIGHALQQNNSLGYDIAQLVFGYASTNGDKETILSGKIFFEDAIASHISGTEFGALKILSSPKPTSFQLYLEQQPNKDNLHNWSSDDHKARGHKLYWHKKSDWRNQDPDIVVSASTQRELITRALELKNTQFTVGEVLKENSSFKGRVRFENLTLEELGAILFVLDLPEGCCHKLGMGKSLGLGSVKITPKLTLVSRKARYEQIFHKNEWHTAEERSIDLQFYKDEFAKYIGKQTKQALITNAEQYWANDNRMQELKHMLTFEHNTDKVSWEDRTRYMKIERPNEYKERPVLPKPSEVVKNNTYRES